MAIMLAIPAAGAIQAGAAISMIVWGAATFAVVPPLQMRAMRVAHEAPGLLFGEYRRVQPRQRAGRRRRWGGRSLADWDNAFVPVMGAIIVGLAPLLVWFSGRAQPEEAFASQ